MIVVIHANAVSWQKRYAPAFVAGFRRHGIKAVVTVRDEPQGDVDVVFANNSWNRTVAECLRDNRPLLTVNRCFFGNRHDNVAIGWDGFNGDADFCVPHNPPPTRWEKHGFEIPQYTTRPKGYVLVCGEYRDIGEWYQHVWSELRAARVEGVRYRPHPFRSGTPFVDWILAPGPAQDGMREALKGAAVCITYDSIAGCDAVLAGIPSITYGPRSMAWPVSYHSWQEYEESTENFDPMPWVHALAWCQWHIDEIQTGDFWNHLRVRAPA